MDAAHLFLRPKHSAMPQRVPGALLKGGRAGTCCHAKRKCPPLSMEFMAHTRGLFLATQPQYVRIRLQVQDVCMMRMHMHAILAW